MARRQCQTPTLRDIIIQLFTSCGAQAGIGWLPLEQGALALALEGITSTQNDPSVGGGT
jgi:hypothetical protein